MATGRLGDAMWGALAGLGATIAVSALAFILTMGLGLALAGVGSFVGWRPGIWVAWLGLALGGGFGVFLLSTMLDQTGWRGSGRVAFVVAFSVSAAGGTALSPTMTPGIDRGAAAFIAGTLTAAVAGATILGPHRVQAVRRRPTRR